MLASAATTLAAGVGSGLGRSGGCCFLDLSSGSVSVGAGGVRVVYGVFTE